MDHNCVIEEVPERLNFITELREGSKTDLYINLLIDTRLLADRLNHVILTNDTFYYRSLNGTTRNVISPTCFLLQHYAERKVELIDFMLSKNYVGIPLLSQHLNENYFKMLSGQPNKFIICLESLRYNWNPDYANINEAITFIKGLYIGLFINERTRTQTTLSIFQNLIIGMPTEIIKRVMLIIQREFRLLGQSLFEVTELFTLAVQRV